MEKKYTIRESLPDRHFEKLLRSITGQQYCFAEAANRKWAHAEATTESSREGFFQLVPVGTDNGFFDWYCRERPYNQFFTSKDAAVVNFLHYWNQWSSMRLANK